VRRNTSSLKPDHFGGNRAAADIEQIVEQRAAGSTSPSTLIGIDLDIVELDARRVVRVDHDGALGRNAFGLGIDQEQRDALGFAREPPVRAATISRSAVWPSTTRALAPLS
jgi:hypothetical protein